MSPTSKLRALFLLKRSAIILYLIFSLPVVIIFLKSEYVRYINYQTVANWRSKIFPPTYIFCGDSITAGGRNFDLRLGWIPFSGLNLAESGYTVLQIRAEVEKALRDHPKYIFIMAGSNDILSGRPTLGQTVMDYESMLALFSTSQSIPVITLVPLTTDPAHNDSINILNSKIRLLAEKYHARLIDLNPELAPKNRLLPIYTVDGVHLSNSAYKIWVEKMRDVLYNDMPNAQRIEKTGVSFQSSPANSMSRV